MVCPGAEGRRSLGDPLPRNLWAIVAAARKMFVALLDVEGRLDVRAVVVAASRAGGAPDATLGHISD